MNVIKKKKKNLLQSLDESYQHNGETDMSKHNISMELDFQLEMVRMEE